MMLLDILHAIPEVKFYGGIGLVLVMVGLIERIGNRS